MTLDMIFNRLWSDYTGQNPEVQKVYDCFTAAGETVVNDHIAFRTLNDARVNIEVLSRLFVRNGYREAGQYVFEEKHLFAKHFEIPGKPEAPKVFISELLTEKFSPFLRNTMIGLIDQIPADKLNADGLIFSGVLWEKPSFKIYEQLRNESEYAGWLYINGFRANHFTVNINALKKLNTIQKVNQFLKDNGFLLNDSGGEIKGTPEELLQQSSIKSGIIRMAFAEGDFDVPGCYYEFAQRYPDKNGKLYNGFIAKSADKIFESTDYYKK